MERTFVEFLAAALRLFGGLLLVLTLGACQDLSDPAPPEALPYRFETVRTTGTRFVPADLNGDGTDEKLTLAHTKRTQASSSFRSVPDALLLETLSGQVIEQVNYSSPIQRPHPVDVNGDGQLEIAVPFVQHDSLFLSVVTAEGTKRGQLYVAHPHHHGCAGGGYQSAPLKHGDKLRPPVEPDEGTPARRAGHSGRRDARRDLCL